MKIKKVTVHNFRSIKHGSFYLENYSLLVGENNAGKSNVFRALRVFYDHDLKFDPKLDLPKFSNSEDKESWIEIEYQTTEEEQENLKEEYRSSNGILIVRKILATEDLKYKTKIEPKQSNIFAYENGILSDNYFYGAQNISLSKLGKIIYIPELSKIDDSLKLSGPSPLREMINFVMKKVVEKSESFSILNKAFEEFNTSFRTEESKDEFSINNIEKDINSEVSNWGIQFGLNLNQIQSADIVKTLVSHYIKDNNLNQVVSIDSFGQGMQRHLIYTLLKLSTKYSDTKQQKKKEFMPDFTLILFEEPEVFLHPSQQEKMNVSLQLLGENINQQVIITTHSPMFVSKNINRLSSLIKIKKEISTDFFQIKEEDALSLFADNTSMFRFFLNKLSDSTIIASDKAEIRRRFASETDDENLKLEQEKFKYALWMDSERTSLFFAKHVLICEGATEKVFLDYLMDTKWTELKDKHIYIVDAMGKFNIHRFMNLLNMLGIKHSVLMDKDSSNIQSMVNEFIDNNIGDYTYKIHYFAKDLEDFLGIATPVRKDLKPLNVMYKYSEGEIYEDKVMELKALFETLV